MHMSMYTIICALFFEDDRINLFKIIFNVKHDLCNNYISILNDNVLNCYYETNIFVVKFKYVLLSYDSSNINLQFAYKI